MPAQPFTEQQVRTRQVGRRGGAAENVDGLLVELSGFIGQGLGAHADGVVAAHRGGCFVGVGIFTVAEVEDGLGGERGPDHVAGATCGRDCPLIFDRAAQGLLVAAEGDVAGPGEAAELPGVPSEGVPELPALGELLFGEGQLPANAI